MKCPTCLDNEEKDDDQMCDHRPRLCTSCCLGGEHDWMPGEAA